MHKNFKKHILDYLFPCSIVIIGAIVFFLNYSFNTWQTGWDTLHPEFNFNLNIPRHLFGIWQDNQGLGSVGGHSHAADISRILILFISSFVFPANFLRYFYLFITIISGPLGTYYFLKHLIFKNIKNRGSLLTYSFIGALFYLFNLGTVGQYIVQLEMYTSLYGFLPLFFLSAILFFKKPTTKRFLFLLVSSFLVAPSGYAYTVFFSSYFCLNAYFINIAIIKYFRVKKLYIKNLIFVNLVIVLVNSYWILPSFYFALSSNSQFVSESNINTIFSTQIFEHNVKHGNFYDLFTNRGFLSDWRNYDFKNDKYYNLFSAWNSYLNTPILKYLIEPIIVISLIGGAYISVKRKNTYSKALFFPFLLAAFMFLTTNMPLGFIFSFLRDHINVFKEMYRNPYTKYSVPLILLYSAFFANFVRFVYLLLVRKVKHVAVKRKVFRTVTLAFSLILVLYCLPAFNGSLINKDIRVDIPNYYFDFFKYMDKEESDQKAAFLPVFSMWGWEYYKWGYQGAGFMWFGLKQPLLARDFDRWNVKNQTYYNEMFNAVYSKDLNKFNNVLNKYDIGFVIYDSSVFSPDFVDAAVFKETIQDLLQRSTQLKFQKQFGTVTVYKNINNPKYVYTPQRLNIDYPFAAINKPIKSSGINIEKQGNQIIYSKKLDIPKGTYKIDIDNIINTEKSLPVEIYTRNSGLNTILSIKYILPHIYVENTSLPIKPLVKDFNLNVPLNKYYLVINNSVFLIDSVSSISKFVGTAFLNTKTSNLINIYQSVPAELEYYSKNNADYFTDCSNGLDKEIAYNNKGVFMASYTNNSCIASKPVSSDSLVEVNLNYTSNTKNFPSLCFKNVTCKSDLFINNQSLLPKKGSAKWYVQNGKNEIITPNLLLENIGTSDVANLNVSEYVYKTYPKISEIIIDTNEIVSDLSSSKINTNVDVASDSKIYFEYNFNPLVKFDSSGLNLISSTEAFVGDSASKKIENNEIVYKSINNSQIYDEYALGKVPNSSSYFINIDSTNVSGYPLSLVISEPSTSLYLLNSLNIASNIFAVYNTSINEQNSIFTDYSKFSVLSNSISQNTSINTVKSLEYYPVSLNWLSTITISKPGNYLTTNNDATYSKLGPFIYKVNKSSDTPVVLSQTFDKGWITYPNLGTTHSLYKGWANVWFNIPAGSFYIIFWPALVQLLLYPTTLISLLFVYFYLAKK